MSDRARQIALILQAMHDLDANFAAEKTAYKDSRTRLENLLDNLRRDILSGQLELVPDPPSEETA